LMDVVSVGLLPWSVSAPAAARAIPEDRQLRLHYKCSAITDTELNQDTGVSASTTLNRHERIIVSPHGFLLHTRTMRTTICFLSL